MRTESIQKLFANDISRRIEEVIKVDQADEAIIKEELTEYVVTDSIRDYFNEVFELYAETPQKPHEGIGIWVSGFFGSGKSSFAKNLVWLCKTAPLQGKVLGYGWPSGSVTRKPRCCSRASPSRSLRRR